MLNGLAAKPLETVTIALPLIYEEYYKKNKDNIEYIYSHPGTYREFEFVDFETKKDSPDSPEYIAKKINKTMFWSCCMNEDKDSKGCQKTVVKKFSWLYD